MSGRRARTALALALGVSVLPAVAPAQTAKIAFPPGLWEGSVFFSGSTRSESFGSGGSHDTTRITVTATDINFQLVVDEKGEVANGAMTVDVEWTQESSGAAPETLTPYNITSDHRQTGSLDMSGTARELVASGSLTSETQIFDSQGDLIEEVSGSEPADVRWVFRPLQAECATVTGKLVEASGDPSLMATALAPRAIFEEDHEFENELVSLFWAWPQIDDPDVILDAGAEVTDAADEALSGQPTFEELLELVESVEALRAELARLEACRVSIPGFSPQSTDSWLSSLLRELLHKALDVPDLGAQEIIALLNLGFRGEAVDGELYELFGDALSKALDDAIADGDIQSIVDIAVAAHGTATR